MGFESMEICWHPVGRRALFLPEGHPNETTENMYIKVGDTVSALPVLIC